MTAVKRRLEIKRAPLPIEDIATDGTFSGYASLFGEVDLGKDRVTAGAFARSLKRRTTGGVRMLYQHDPAQPIGTWLSIAEDARGLLVRGRISTSSEKGREVLGLLRDGAIDGLSIGFRTTRSQRDAKTGIRTILEADLWEISVVTFPMLPSARISDVKAVPGQGRALPSVREFERWLTRDAGLSRKEARAVIGKGFNSLIRKQDAVENDPARLAQRIRSASRIFISK